MVCNLTKSFLFTTFSYHTYIHIRNGLIILLFKDVRMNVIGTDGVLNLNFTPMDLYACDRDGWKLPDTRHWPTMNGKLTGAAKAEVEHFFECVLNDQEPLVSGLDGRRSIEIMLAAEMSIAEDRVVELPL